MSFTQITRKPTIELQHMPSESEDTDAVAVRVTDDDVDSPRSLVIGASLSFENLEYFINVKNNKAEKARTGQHYTEKRVIKGVSGIAKAGASS